ncbi:MAG: hypothetical protein ACO3N4_01420 [Ilumatobacteraceae bacterium]|jgi:predicted phosphodiesterase
MWLRAADAAAELEISTSTLRDRKAAGKIATRPDPEYPHLNQYWCGDSSPAESPTSAPREDGDPCDADSAGTQHLTADDEVRTTGATVERDGYVYVGSEDTYIVQCAPAGGHLVRPGAWVRRLWRAYTAGGMTIAEITREFEIDRASFSAVKHSLCLTKTRAPWTDEEIAGSTIGALTADALRAREREAMVRADRRDWNRTRQDAQRWREVHDALRDAVSELDIPAVSIDPESCDRGPWDCIVGTTDLHVGKRTHDRDHTLREQVDGLRALLARVPSDVRSTWGEMPDRWIVPVGSDLLHSDTYSQTTTSGTAQGAQSVGSTAQALRAAIELMAGLIDLLATTAPVLAVHVPGNHDRVLGHAVALALDQRYRDEARVTVDTSETPHKVIAIGRVPLMLHHGDGADAKRAAATLRREAPRDCDIRHAMIAHGHLHARRAQWQDDHGVLTVCMGSPASADDWHATKHYTGSRRCVGVWRVHHSGRLPMPMWCEV